MAAPRGFKWNQATLDAYMAGQYGVDAVVKAAANKVYQSAKSNAEQVASDRSRITDYDESAPNRHFEDYPSSIFMERTTHDAVSERPVKNGHSRLTYIIGSTWTRPWVTRLPNGSGNTGSLWVERLFQPLTRALASHVSSGKIRTSSGSLAKRTARLNRRRSR